MAELDSEEPTAWAIREVRARYHRPARVDDALDGPAPRLSPSPARASTARQKIYCGDILLVEGRIEACIITLTGKPRRLPQSLRRFVDTFSRRNRYLRVIRRRPPYFGQF